MNKKQDILTAVQEALNTGVITTTDLLALAQDKPEPATVVTQPQQPSSERKPDKLSAVDVMFYIAGIIFFSAIMSIVTQSWDSGSVVVNLFLTVGVGSSLWSLAYFLIKSSVKSDIRRGLINALILTGSLSIIVGGYLVVDRLVNGSYITNYFVIATALVVLGSIHLAYDRLVKKDLTLLMGVLLCVAALPVVLFAILGDADISMDVWALIAIATAGLLAFATRVVTKVNSDRQRLRNAFDSLAVFAALLAMYVASNGQNGTFWLMLLIASIFGIFYLSIILQNKKLLGSASFFLVLTIITVSFKYFSGYGATTCLVLAGLGLLGTAALASNINKKYFKQVKPAPSVPEHQQ